MVVRQWDVLKLEEDFLRDFERQCCRWCDEPQPDIRSETMYRHKPDCIIPRLFALVRRSVADEEAMELIRTSADLLRTLPTAGLLAMASSFTVQEGPDITVERMRQRDGGVKWAIRRRGSALAKDGAWGYEPMPSSRDDDFIAHYRWDDRDEAIAAARAAANSETTS